MITHSTRQKQISGRYYTMRYPRRVYDVTEHRIPGEWSFPAHHQDGVEVIFTIDVVGTALIGGRIYQIGGNSIICVGPDTVHSYRFSGSPSGKIVVLVLEIGFLDAVLQPFNPGNKAWLRCQLKRSPFLTGPEVQRIRQPLTKLLWYRINILGEEPDIDPGPQALEDVRHLYQIISEVLGSSSDASVTTPHIDPRIQTIVKVLDSFVRRTVSLDEIADACAVSKFHLCRIFQKHTGTTVGDYLTRLRIERAKRLLMTGELKTSDVAQQCGFTSLSYFIRVFSKAEGITPKQWILRLVSKSPNV